MDIRYIDSVDIKNKRVLIRVDYNVSLTKAFTISDDLRIKQSLPTLQHLLDQSNKLILISHLGRPNEKNPHYSLKIVAKRLQDYMKNYKVIFIEDFTNEEGKKKIAAQQPNEIILLENIRFYPEERVIAPEFVGKLKALADIYVNDAFGVSHRADASIIGLPAVIPSYGGLLLKKEVEAMEKLVRIPKKPFVAIIGGAKIETKIPLLNKLLGLADYLIVGGMIANVLLSKNQNEMRNMLLTLAKEKHTELVLPVDGIVADSKDATQSELKKVDEIGREEIMYDIGPQTEALFGSIIASAKTLVWNGPMGYVENPQFRRGTDFIYYAITDNKDVHSVVGGGDTIAAISKDGHLEKITHISTGGGAMLEFIEMGTLPGLEALKKSTSESTPPPNQQAQEKKQ